MSERINHKNLKDRINNLIDLEPSDLCLEGDFNAELNTRPIYRCVLGCTLNGNSASRSSEDVKPIKKEESKSLALGGR
jgi:hypothetical protein